MNTTLPVALIKRLGSIGQNLYFVAGHGLEEERGKHLRKDVVSAQAVRFVATLLIEATQIGIDDAATVDSEA